MPILRTRLGLPALLIAAVMSGCATAAPASAPTPSASPTASPSPTPAVAIAADGESLVPAECSDLVGAQMAGLGLEVEPASEADINDAMLTQAGVLSCRFESAASGYFGSMAVGADVGETWDMDLVAMGAIEGPTGELAMEYCWGEPELANHCGVRLGANEYGAEFFLNNSEPGTVIEPLRRAAVELSAALESLPDPLARPAGTVAPTANPSSCAGIPLESTPVVGAIPELGQTAVDGDRGDPPQLYFDAVRSTGQLMCAWGPVSFGVLPGGGWALEPGELLSQGAELAVAGATTARWSRSEYNPGQIIMYAATPGTLIQVWGIADPTDLGEADRVAQTAAIAESILIALQ